MDHDPSPTDPKPSIAWETALRPPHTGPGRWSLGLAAATIVLGVAHAVAAASMGPLPGAPTAPLGALQGLMLGAGLAGGASAWRALRRLGDRSVLLAAPVLTGLWAAVAVLGLVTDRL